MTTINQLFGQNATVSSAGVLTLDLAELAVSAGYDGDFVGISGSKAIAIILSSFRDRLGDTSADPSHGLSFGSDFRTLVTRGGVDMVSYTAAFSLYAPDTVGGLDPDNVL